MNFQLSAILLVILATVVFAAPGSPGRDKIKLRFKVLARGLKDKDKFGTIDPYFKLYYTENEGTSETRIGKSHTLSNTENPDWPDVFTFEFDRYKRQSWHFYVYDNDAFRRDDKAGDTWVSVSEYVDRGEYMQVNLNKKGYLIIKKA